jgi:hypothetical protein
MREIRLSGSEGGGFEFNRFSLPLSMLGHLMACNSAFRDCFLPTAFGFSAYYPPFFWGAGLSPNSLWILAKILSC